MTASGNRRPGRFFTRKWRTTTLDVLTGRHVDRIRVENRRAVAVHARDVSGQTVLIRAEREIILNAGSFHSPGC